MIRVVGLWSFFLKLFYITRKHITFTVLVTYTGFLSQGGGCAYMVKFIVFFVLIIQDDLEEVSESELVKIFSPLRHDKILIMPLLWSTKYV